MNELQGEKIDVVSWDPDPKTFIARAISPSEVLHVELEPSEQTAVVVVPDKQLSLAIGKEGQNARLAARLSGWRLDIKGLVEWEQIKEALIATKLAEAALVTKPEGGTVDVLIDSDGSSAVRVGETDVLVEVGNVEETNSEVKDAVSSQSVDESGTGLDEEALLEALIKEEEDEDIRLVEDKNDEGTGSSGLSVDELADFTLDEVEEELEDDSAEEEELEDVPPQVPLLTPDAGKIRFAEDLMGEFRGPSRANRRAARRGGAKSPAKGNNRGSGGR